MSATTRTQGSAVILDLEGKLGLGPAVDEFRTAWSDALAAGSRKVVVNLANVPVIDSSGIGVLVRCHAAIAAKGGKMTIAGACGVVREALKLTHVDQLLEFHENEASALASLGA
jgi:anti-sigma B factor antagonist